MAQPIVIEVVLTAKNQTGAGIKEASKFLDTLIEYAGKTEDALNSLIAKTKETSELLGQDSQPLDALSESAEEVKKELDSIDCSKAQKEFGRLETSSKRVERELKELARDRHEILLEAKDKISSVLSSVKGGIRGIAGKTWNVTLKAVDYITRPVRGILSLLSSVQGAVFGAAGIFGGFVTPMDIAGDYEQTEIAFATMLKDAEKAKEFLADASDFANDTPFEFPELIDSSKLLLAFGFDPDSILPILETIGDTSSGLGAGSEGIDRITRALGQIQAKGRVLTEELMQLQEVGIPVSEILQEELGLTREQIADIGKEGVDAEDAISALLRGMDKRYGGMMENQSKTAKGLISTISDTLQNTFMRRWGIGLWEGFKPGLEKIADWLDENQDTVDEWADRLEDMGSTLSRFVISQVERAQRALKELSEDPAWKGSGLFGKIEIAWDRLIADPFTEWWDTTGKEKVSDIAEEFGDFLGTGLNRGIMALLGIDDTGVVSEGISIGKSFLDGFLDGFDKVEIQKAIKETFSGIYKDSFFGGGNSETTGLSTAFIGMLGLKGLSAGVGLGKGIYQTVSAVNLLKQFFGLTGTAAAGTAAAGTAATGTAAAGTAAGGGASIIASLSVPAIASVSGAVLGMMGLKSSLTDFLNSRKALLSKDREVLTKRGLARGGMVATGAAIGSMIAPGVGTLVGGGIGGLAALFSGNMLSELFKSESEKALESLDGLGKGLEDAVKEYNETASQVELAQGLLDEYKELKDYMNSDDFDSTKAEEAQDRMKQILEDIDGMFPGLISGYEMLNGLGEDRIGALERELDLVEEQSEFQMEQAKRELESGVLDVKTQMPKIREDYQEINEKLVGKQAEWKANHEYYSEMADIYTRYIAVDYDSEEAKGFLKDATELSKKYEGEDYSNYVVSSGKFGTDMGNLRDKEQKFSEELKKLIQEQDDLDKKLEGYYNSSVLLAEMDTGIDLDAEQQKLETLQAAYNNLKSTGTIDDGLKEDVEEILPGFEAASNAGEQMELLSSGILGVKNEVQPLLEKIDELNKELDLLPENKKINIRLDFSGPTPSEITFFKWNMNPLVGDGSPSVEKNAFGGFISRPELSWIGEDGPEAIIPLSGKYRRRGLELYEQAGRYLGVSYNGDGGVYGSVQGGQTAAWQEGGAGTVTVPVTLSPQAVIQINQGSTADEVKGAVWQSLVEMLDPLAMQIANIVMRSQENSPGGGV